MILRTEFSSACLLSEHFFFFVGWEPSDADFISFINLFKIFTEAYYWQALAKCWGFSVETHSLGQRWQHTQITVIQCGKCYNLGSVSSECSGNPGGSLWNNLLTVPMSKYECLSKHLFFGNACSLCDFFSCLLSYLVPLPSSLSSSCSINSPRHRVRTHKVALERESKWMRESVLLTLVCN